MNPLIAPPDARSHTALSVNVNKVALLRNTRHLGIPSVVQAAALCLEVGAQGITVHPRPDERHIRAHDVHELAALMQQWPQADYNIEGNPFQNLMPFIRSVRPRQATFVPDGEGQFTSDHGWNLAADGARLRPLIAECHALGVRVSLFMDAEPAAMALAREIGADRVELYTEPYAVAHATASKDSVVHATASKDPVAHATASKDPAAHATASKDPMAHATASKDPAAHGQAGLRLQLQAFAAAAAAAQAQGLGVNAGHDLNRDNLADFLRAVPGVLEVSIGHALIADALVLGLAETVRAYQRCIDAAVPR